MALGPGCLPRPVWGAPDVWSLSRFLMRHLGRDDPTGGHCASGRTMIECLKLGSRSGW